MKDVKNNRSKKASVLIKALKAIVICLILLAVIVFGLYSLVTYQWQDEPQTYSSSNKYITDLGETMISAHRAGRRLFPQGTMMAFEGCVNAEDFETDIFEAIKNTNVANVIYITKMNGLDPNTTINKDGENVLQFAIRQYCNIVYNGYFSFFSVGKLPALLRIIKYLIKECKADIYIEDKNQNLPIHIASQSRPESGSIDVIKFLIEECGVDFNIKGQYGKNILHFASENDHIELVKYLIEECNVDPNTNANGNWTPLHFASRSGSLKVVKYLIEKCNVDKDIIDNEGWTPLHFASSNYQFEVVVYLYEQCKANKNRENKEGKTPLDLAKEKNYYRIIECFNKHPK